MKNEEEKVDWWPHPGPQTEALLRDEFEILYGGSRGGGKTEAGLAWLLYDIENPHYRFLVIRRNADDLSDWLDRARTFFARQGADITGRPATIKFPSGAVGRVGHLKDENAYDHYQGHEYHKIVIEELTQIPREDRYLKLLSSCRSTRKGLKPQAFLTTNPGGPGHVWVKNRFVQHGPFKRFVDPISGRDRIFIPARLKDNPTLMESDPSYEAYLRSLPEQTRKAWLDGNWDVFEGQFFNDWNSDVHVCDPFDIPKEWARYIGLDYGYAAPSAVTWFAVSPNGMTYQYRELYETGLTYEKLREKILFVSRGEKIEGAFVDPALKARSQGTGIVGLEVLNEHQQQIKFWPADNDRLNGWTRVREYFRPRKDAEGKFYSWLKIFRSCNETIRTVPEMVHDDIKKEDLMKDSDDHLCDSIRYFCMGRPMPYEVKKDAVREKMRPQDRSFWEFVDRIKKEPQENFDDNF